MRRIKLTVAYDGTNYCGWQIQPNGITVEEVLNRALSRLTGEKLRVTGASRTDAGVHARGNIAVFDTASTIPAERFAYAVNPLLPEDIAVVNSEEVPQDWHPRYQNSVKTYEYRILNREMPDPLRRNYTWHVSFPLASSIRRQVSSNSCCLSFFGFLGICSHLLSIAPFSVSSAKPRSAPTPPAQRAGCPAPLPGC